VIFSDTSALYALLVPGDQYHARAAAARIQIQQQREVLWTIDPVLTELWLLLRRGVGFVRADRYVRGLLDSGLRREPLEPADYTRAWQIATEWSDQRFSLTDRQAFAAMERSRRIRAWAYDQDYQVIRLGPRHNQPLELI
jgi:predicted nucleic acid-binding protein